VQIPGREVHAFMQQAFLLVGVLFWAFLSLHEGALFPSVVLAFRVTVSLFNLGAPLVWSSFLETLGFPVT